MPESIWTEGSHPVEVSVGEVWNVRFPPESRVYRCKVLALGFKTVKLMEMPFSYISRVLERDRVVFIEREEDD